MSEMPIKEIENLVLDENLVKNYIEYLEIRVKFLLNRYNKFPDFPGVQTGYNSITGEEFSKKDIFSYSWINGRGACVFARFADCFHENRKPLMEYALHTIKAMKRHLEINNRHFPFMVHLDGTEKLVGFKCPRGYKSYSDLYACAGFIEYGIRAKDRECIQMAGQMFEEIITSLDANKFVTEPDPIPEDRILENPWSCALDLANEFTKHLSDKKFLNISARLIGYLMDKYYIKDLGAYIEYITPEGKPFIDEKGRYIVDPGHSIEFCSFSLEFCRLAEKYKIHTELCKRINEIIPRLISWNIEKGWNKRHSGIYKTIDAKSGLPINDTMPWWILPETLLAVILAYEKTKDEEFLVHFKNVHDAYFTNYINPKTDFGPFQNIDGKTGKPIDIIPACKFQDPEFHSGRNILTVIGVINRINSV